MLPFFSLARHNPVGLVGERQNLAPVPGTVILSPGETQGPDCLRVFLTGWGCGVVRTSSSRSGGRREPCSGLLLKAAVNGYQVVQAREPKVIGQDGSYFTPLCTVDCRSQLPYARQLGCLAQADLGLCADSVVYFGANKASPVPWHAVQLLQRALWHTTCHVSA